MRLIDFVQLTPFVCISILGVIAGVVSLFMLGVYCLTGDTDAIWERRQRGYERRGFVTHRPDNWDSRVRIDGLIYLVFAIGLAASITWLFFRPLY